MLSKNDCLTNDKIKENNDFCFYSRRKFANKRNQKRYVTLRNVIVNKYTIYCVET